jgi:hypothetical protein
VRRGLGGGHRPPTLSTPKKMSRIKSVDNLARHVARHSVYRRAANCSAEAVR